MILSKTLIAILLLLSPLTFSTDSVPNFQPDCETHVSLKEKNRVVCAVIRSMVPEKAHTEDASQLPLFTAAPVLPPSNSPSFSSPSRAPPV